MTSGIMPIRGGRVSGMDYPGFRGVLAKIRRNLRFMTGASTLVRPRIPEGSAFLRVPPITGIDGSLEQISRPTFAQLACFAARAPGGACIGVPASELLYLSRLRAKGVGVTWPMTASEPRADARLVIDGTTDGSGLSTPGAPRRWNIKFDFQPGMPLADREHVLPYTMNPSILVRGLDRTLRASTDADRPIRVLFAGTWNGHAYRRPELIRDLFGKMPRFDAVSGLLELDFPIHRAAGNGWIDRLPRDSRVVLADTDVARVPQGEWLDAVKQADFMICPPGCVMPLCYNLVEAMACGTVPITSYPEWLTPGLRDGVECLSFETAEDLRQRVIEAVHMPARVIRTMRRAARSYYLRHLDLDGVFHRLLAAGPGELTLHAVDETKERARTMAPPRTRPATSQPQIPAWASFHIEAPRPTD